MFWSSQMLSLTEFCSGSSVSIFTAFASTNVSVLAVRCVVRRVAAAATPATTSATTPNAVAPRAIPPSRDRRDDLLLLIHPPPQRGYITTRQIHVTSSEI